MDEMTPSRPYVLRAFYDWLLDNDLTPHLLVNAEVPHTEVPHQYVNDGQIVLNISPGAVVGLHMDNEAVSFNARFSGQSLSLYIPTSSIIAIYARENDQGIMFSANMYSDETNEPELAPIKDENGSGTDGNGADANGPDDDPPKPPKGKPNLKVVK